MDHLDRRTVLSAASALALVSPAAAAATGKDPISTDGTDPKSWDPKNEALVAAPGNHRLVYEDALIRILLVTVPAGSEEPYHDHLYPSVLVFYDPAKVFDRDIHGKPVDEHYIDYMKRPFAVSQPPQALHSVKNLDTKDVHLIRIEYKKGFPPTPPLDEVGIKVPT